MCWYRMTATSPHKATSYYMERSKESILFIYEIRSLPLVWLTDIQYHLSLNHDSYESLIPLQILAPALS